MSKSEITAEVKTKTIYMSNKKKIWKILLPASKRPRGAHEYLMVTSHIMCRQSKAIKWSLDHSHLLFYFV